LFNSQIAHDLFVAGMCNFFFLPSIAVKKFEGVGRRFLLAKFEDVQTKEEVNE
jgi:hypothetical protein